MADLSVMSFLNEETQQEAEYNIKDVQARQSISTIEGKIPSAASSSNKLVDTSTMTTELNGKVNVSSVGANNGVAGLDGNGLVPATQLPSYVDDVLEGTAQNVTETSAGTFAATGFILKGESVLCILEDGKTYVDIISNIQYRWTGSGNNLVSMGSNLALGETANTAYAGSKGKANADAIVGIQEKIPNSASYSNKLVTENDLPSMSNYVQKSSTVGVIDNNGTIKAVDDFPMKNSNNLVTSGGVRMANAEIYGTIAPIEGDLQSENAYAVGEHFLSVDGFCTVIKPIAVGDTLTKNVNYKEGTIDAAITESNNAIKANTKLIKDTVGWSGKNLRPLNSLAGTIHGLTFVDNSDGSFSVSGTATSTDNRGRNTFKLDAGNYILSGITGGSSDKFELHLKIAGTTDIMNYGGDTSFTIASDGTECIYEFIYRNGAVINTTVYPMIRKADILDPTYEPYHDSVKDTLREAEVIEGKNLLAPKWQVGTGTGITFTKNSDGSITANGTATGDNTFVIPKPDMPTDTPLILNGCPSGGSGSTYFMQYTNEVDNAYNDFGSGVNITKFNYSTYANAKIAIKIKSGQTVSNLVFKPMIRLATETDPTYEPYYIPLKDSMFPRSEQAVTGAVNLLQNNGVNKEENGVVFTFPGDGTVVVNGTATANTGCSINAATIVKKGWKIVGCPSGGGADTFEMQVYKSVSPYTTYAVDRGNGAIISADDTASVNIVIRNGYHADNLIFKPMITLDINASYDDYVPHVMTNQQLTKEIGKQFVDISSNNTTFNIPWKRESSGRYSFGLLMYAGGLYHVMVKGPTDSNTVYLTKIVDTDANRTLTGSFADDVLTITASSTLYGGITAILNNIVKS